MTREEAIRILDPETTGEALAEIEYYNGFTGKTAAVQAVSDACVLAVAALREQENLRWIPVAERLPKDDSDVLAYLRIGEEGRIYPANYAKGVWWDCIFNTPATKTTTHWMPLPEPPEEDE